MHHKYAVNSFQCLVKLYLVQISYFHRLNNTGVKVIIAVFLLICGTGLMAQNVEAIPIARGQSYFQGYADIGYTAALSTTNANGLRANFVLGVGFSNRFFLGAGPGIRMSKNMRTFPVFVDFRYGNLMKKQAFFFAVGGGATFGSFNSFQYNGPASHADVGLRFNNDRGGAFYFSVGCEFFSAEIMETTGGFTRYTRGKMYDLQLLTFGIGFSFL